jgi:glutathione S-transferase
MYKIYARPSAGNACVEAMLAACGAHHEVIVLERDSEHRLPERLRALNPMMQVPTLVLPDGQVMTESAAMMIHLGDTFPEAGLAPGIASPLRAPYLRWMLFLATTLYMSDLRLFYPHRYTVDQACAGAVKAQAALDMENEFAILAGVLGENNFLLGRAMTALDIYAAMFINWSPDIAALAAKHPNLKALHDRVAQHPRIAPVWLRNEMI